MDIHGPWINFSSFLKADANCITIIVDQCCEKLLILILSHYFVYPYLLLIPKLLFQKMGYYIPDINFPSQNETASKFSFHSRLWTLTSKHINSVFSLTPQWGEGTTVALRMKGISFKPTRTDFNGRIFFGTDGYFF